MTDDQAKDAPPEKGKEEAAAKPAETAPTPPADKPAVQDESNGVEAEQPPLREYVNARNFLLWASVIGVALPFVFAAQSGSITTFATVSAVGIGILAASMAAGGLLGFLFGIPTSLQNAPTPQPDGQGSSPTALYVGNTSLEQISDWLTKILVGVGLTQLASIPTALGDLGSFLAVGLGNLPGAQVFATLLVVFALLDGFFLSYLWTRLNLGSLLAQSDVNQRVAAAEEKGLKKGKAEAKKDALVEASAAIKSADVAPTEQIEVLWVDDNPDYNTNERQTIRNLWPNTKFELARSTDEALEFLKAKPDRFGLVITDMGRPGDREAGFTLLRRMNDEGIKTPSIVYAASASPARETEARRLGANGMTNDPNRLVRLVADVMRDLGAVQAETESDEPADGSSTVKQGTA